MLATLWAFAIFGFPISQTVWLYQEPSVRYFIGGQALLMLAVPACLVLAHLVHVVLGRPRFFAVLLYTVVPSVVVIVVGLLYLRPIRNTVDGLESKDCWTYKEKRYLDEAYLAAQPLYESCAKRQAEELNTTLRDARAHSTLLECAEYRKIMAADTEPFVQQWRYLESVVPRELCSGWCTRLDHPLWATPLKYKDSMAPCPTVVSYTLREKATRECSRMVATGIVDLLLTVVGLMWVNSWYERMNIRW